MLWNGAGLTENPPVPKCYGVATNRYVGRDTLQSAIEDDFCRDAVQSGVTSLSRRYKPGTMDEVLITVESENPAMSRSKDECVQHLVGSITDGCDGNDPMGNPINYKAGGELRFGDAYFIEPQMLVRQPARLGLNGGCSSTYKVVYTKFWVWGHGWASDDRGEVLKSRLQHHTVTAWNFDYGLGDDGREWTATFHMPIGKKGSVEAALKAAGAPLDIRCSGSG
jgi:hypothetical protein